MGPIISIKFDYSICSAFLEDLAKVHPIDSPYIILLNLCFRCRYLKVDVEPILENSVNKAPSFIELHSLLWGMKGELK